MANFMIAYDLKQQGQNYTCIVDKLKKMNAFHSQGSVWLYKGTTTCAAIRNALQSCLDENDELAVVQIEDWASCNMPHDTKYITG
ncbi:hypothetical protein [Agrobacterium tumefaciens]|uniref:hypothetical protein n=1 Tax=Agrobacterium tumefaciens TaxID=358 RepID=UPI001CBB7199|nr:hypothetical protein [Agrobacterium tumefaciens]